MPYHDMQQYSVTLVEVFAFPMETIENTHNWVCQRKIVGDCW